jgi:hypothetical protein
MNGLYSTAEIALFLKIIKILIYFGFQALFLRRASRKWADGEPVTLEVCTSAFFFCMMLGSLSEIIWIETNYSFYESIGASYIYFIGFIALTFLSIGIERTALKTKGIIAIIPFGMAVFTLIIGIQITAPPYYFLALIVAIIPLLFLYQGFKSEGLIRRQFLYIGVGFFLVFAGEAFNYFIVETNFPWLLAAWNITGISFHIVPPFLILLGLLCLLNGYVRLPRKLAL